MEKKIIKSVIGSNIINIVLKNPPLTMDNYIISVPIDLMINNSIFTFIIIRLINNYIKK